MNTAFPLNQEPDMPYKDYAIYLDMDGVIADYETAIRNLGFDIDPTIKNELNRPNTGDPFKRRMYEAVKGTRFYAELPMMPGAARLYNAVRGADPIILTAGPTFGEPEALFYKNPYWNGAAYNKRYWIEHILLPEALGALEKKPLQRESQTAFIPIEDERFICTTSSSKQEYIGWKKSDHQILFDDRRDNCINWAKAGGTAIHHDGNVDASLKLLDWYRQTLTFICSSQFGRVLSSAHGVSKSELYWVDMPQRT